MCAISIGSALRPLEPAQVIEWVETFGPDRIMLNSDHLGYRPIDILSVPKTLRAMRNAGLSDEAIRKVSFENAREVLQSLALRTRNERNARPFRVFLRRCPGRTDCPW